MRIKTSLLALLLLVMSAAASYGTEQAGDILIYQSDTLILDTFPLESLPAIDSLRGILFGDQQVCISTACWRQYRAEWMIIDGRLYLTNIFSCCFSEDHGKADIKRLFPENFENGKVRADWVTQELTAQDGEFLFFDPGQFISIFETQRSFTFDNGKLVATKSYDNSKSQQSTYTHNPEKLSAYLYSLINWEKLPKQAMPVKVWVRFSANEEGKVDRAEVMRGADEIFDAEAVRVVKSIPEWDVIYKRGQHERRTLVLPIVFNAENKAKGAIQTP